jgi:hypothetical protein
MTAGAQQPSVTNTVAWYSVVGDHRFGTSPWSLVHDQNARRSGLIRDWQQLLLRAGLQRDLGGGASAVLGYAYVVTHQYGADPVDARFPEHRLWGQLAMSHAVRGLQLLHRYRFEHRRLGVMDTTGRATGDGDAVADWRTEHRARYLLRVTRAFGGARRGPYVTAYNEAFVTLGRSARANLLDQNRTFGGVGWRFSPTWRAETGYLRQLVVRGSGASERNDALQVVVTTTAPFGS